MTPQPPGDTPTPTKRVEAAITKADRCMNHDGAMKVFSPLVRDLASELTAALSKAKDFEKLFNEAIEIREDLRVELADAIAQVDELRRERDEARKAAERWNSARGWGMTL